MTVKELMNLLSGYSPQMKVIVEGYESGYNHIKSLEIIPIVDAPKSTCIYGELMYAPDEDNSIAMLHIKGIK